jgi:hypothetical protein
MTVVAALALMGATGGGGRRLGLAPLLLLAALVALLSSCEGGADASASLQNLPVLRAFSSSTDQRASSPVAISGSKPEQATNCWLPAMEEVWSLAVVFPGGWAVMGALLSVAASMPDEGLQMVSGQPIGTGTSGTPAMQRRGGGARPPDLVA